MQLPNKVTKYEQSIFPVMLSILEIVEKAPEKVSTLYVNTRFRSNGVGNFIDALDALYALKMISLNDKGEISYVDRDL